MPNVKLSEKSVAKLNTIRMELRNVCFEAFKTMPFDIMVLEGYRTKERQQELFDEGKTKVKTSRHQSGFAVDLAPYPIDWNDTARFKIMAEHMFAAAKKLGITIRWGGNWSRNGVDDKPPSSFVDMPHFEIPA